MQEQELDTAQNESLAEQLGLNADYEPVVLEPVDGYGQVVDAWVRMKYPLNVSERFDSQHGVIECGNWRHARQFPDGSGHYKSGPSGQLLAYRTAGGVIIWNNYHGHPWPYNSEAADEVVPDEQFQVPFQFIGELLTRQTDLDLHDEDTVLARGRDEDAWVDGELWMRGVVRADVVREPDEGVLLEHADGSQVYVGLDDTAHDHPMFGFVPFDGEEGIKVPTPRDALDLLRPDEALAADRRQGEWFFIEAGETYKEADGRIQNPGVGEKEWAYEAPGFPQDVGQFPSRHEAIGAVTKALSERMRRHARDYIADVEPTKTYHCGSPLESHIPRDWKPRVNNHTFVRRVVEELRADRYIDRDLEHGTSSLWQDTPQDIFDKIEAGTIDLDHATARELAGGIYVRGSVRHRDNEHTMTTLADWHQPATHGREVLVLEPEDMNVHVDV